MLLTRSNPVRTRGGGCRDKGKVISVSAIGGGDRLVRLP